VRPSPDGYAEIGNPFFHDAINKAIAHYVATGGDDDFYIIDRIKDAVIAAGGASRHHGIYLKDHYLKQSLRGARAKFTPIG